MSLCLFFPFQSSLFWLCFVGLPSYVALFSCSSLLRESKMDMDVKESEGIIPKWYFEKKIVIVGAGVSGLSAASELQKLGFKNVVILEAKNTTGGRIRTMHFGSDFIEIGAEWIHGQKGNHVYEIACNHGLVEEHCPDYMESLFKWDHVTDRKQREAISSTFTMLENVMDKIDDHEASVLPKTLEEYLSDQFENYMLLCSDSDQIKLIKRAVYDWYVKLQFELNGCRSLSDVSCKLLRNYKECEGCHVTELKSGYSSFLNVLCKNIPESWIKKNMEVKTITWKNVSSGTVELDEKMGELQLSDKNKTNENHIVSIDCVNGEKYIADHVIVTVPLGYLKKSHGSLFVPPLPSDKVKAIECIGFHSLNKIFLEFDEPFWERHSVFNMLWINEDFETLVNNGSLHQCPGASWHKFISRFAYVSHHPKMLCAWIVGDGAVFMESLPEKQVLDKCHELLQQQLGQRDIPFPHRIIRSQWGTDPCTHGSYSYLSVGCEEAGVTNEELASPITRKFDSSPLLQFAGEATHSSYYSTVHGAYESGIREAHRIFDYYRYHSHHGQNGIIHGMSFKQKSVPLDYHHHFLNAAHVEEKPCVVVIGAGAAGLSCAQRLYLNGFNNLIILEAQNREGGRIHTQQCENGVLELGAQWVHGEECNPLYEFCESLGLLSNPLVDFSVEGKGHFYTSQGTIISEQLVDEVIMFLEGIKETISSHSYPHTQPPRAVTSVFERGFADYLSSCSDSPYVTSVKKGIFDWYLRFEVIDNACDNLDEISTLGYAEWTECPGVYHINFKNGFESFIRTLCKYLPVDTIKYRKAVKCVHWKKSLISDQTAENNLMEKPPESYPVVVECSDGDLIGADSVIVTSSIGYLRSNLTNFFHPQLPTKKATAIENAGFGTINKIFLIFDKPFWSKQDLGFQLVWTESEDKFLVQNSWVHGISGFDIVWKQPNTLVGWIGGPEAVQVEKIPSEKIGKACVEMLRRFLNKKDIPYPIQVVRSSWNSNPYIKGSYSSRPQKFFDAGCHVSDLIEPLNCSYVSNSGSIVEWPAVMFAGEATDPEYFSSVHGAMRSGWREADRIIQCCRIHGTYSLGAST